MFNNGLNNTNLGEYKDWYFFNIVGQTLKSLTLTENYVHPNLG
jgi:hypothetical protein